MTDDMNNFFDPMARYDFLKKATHIKPKEERITKIKDGLNEQQTAMVQGIIEYIFTENDKNYFLVQGGGGVGKSYAISRVLNLLDKEFKITAGAPSHFAKNILKDFLDNENIEVNTVASMLGKKITFNSSGDLILVKNYAIKVPAIKKADIVIIDEVSMIDDDTANELLVECRDKKLIILGDYCQLPPVKQDEDSKFFKNISAELTIPMRFVGPLLTISQKVRDEINQARKGLFATVNIMNIATDRESKIDENGSGYIFLNNFDLLIKAVVKRYKMNRGSKYIRVLAYRNKTIDTINTIVRKRLYGKDADQFEKGELVINEGGFKKSINNGEVLVVSSFYNIEGPYAVKCLKMFFENKSCPDSVFVVSREGKADYEKKLNALKVAAKADSRKWKQYYEFLDSFAHFKYSYANSVHKAQGSSIDHVFILEDDILSVKPTSTKEKLQSLYVAVTRASFRAYIYNAEFKVNNKNLTLEHLKKDSDE